MILFRRLLVVMFIGGVFAACFLAGCGKQPLGARRANIPPETTLSFSPDDGDTANYRVRMNWFGWDPDGEIAHFRTKWDTLGWVTVVNTDSTFQVSASADSIDENRGYEYHTFSVKAVDNEGAEDETPETISFTAYTIVPETQIVRGPSGVTGPMVTFEWMGSDRDGVIVGYEWVLLQERAGEPGVYDTAAVSGPLGPETTSWTTPGKIDGDHKFLVWSIDDAGAVDQTPAMRSFRCMASLAGPRLYIGTNVFGYFTFRGPKWPSSFDLPIPIFAGERLRFGWAASAADYGGQIVGFRHAYDDTSTWPPWSLYDYYFEVMPELGRHSLYIKVLDNAAEVTKARIYFDVVQASLDEYMLVVDDYDFNETLPGWGTDEQRSGFYDQNLAGYARHRVEWEPSQHGNEAPNVDALRGASTVIWYCDGKGQTLLEAQFDPFETTYNALAGYVRVGGNLILAGTKCISEITGQTNYPIQIDEADSSQAAEFVRDFLRISWADNSEADLNPNAPWNYGLCFYGAIPAPDFEDMFIPMYIDSVGPGGWPEPGKWPVYTWPYTGYKRGGLSEVEKLQVYQETGLRAFLMDSHLNQNYANEPCAVLYLSGDNHGNSCYFGFPLYYLQDDQVEPNLDQILALFGEEMTP